MQGRGGRMTTCFHLSQLDRTGSGIPRLLAGILEAGAALQRPREAGFAVFLIAIGALVLD